MDRTRRKFLMQSASAAASMLFPWSMTSSAQQAIAAIRIGSCMIGLDAAKKAGLDGVQLDLKLSGDRLQIADPQVREQYKRQMHDTGLPICALMAGIFNTYPLASDPRGGAWLQQAIDAAADLGAKSILVAFFGNGDLLDARGQIKSTDVDAVVARLKSAAPRAADAGVTLAIENYLDARQNLQILDGVGHKSVQIWYDVYNTGATKGYDVPSEIRLLKGCIAQFHYKNGAQFLGEGKLDFKAITAAIRQIGYAGWIVLETSSPSGDPIADARRNADYVRKLLAEV